MSHRVHHVALASTVGSGEMRYYSVGWNMQTHATKSYAWTFKPFKHFFFFFTPIFV